jgi:hypothetical protein
MHCPAKSVLDDAYLREYNKSESNTVFFFISCVMFIACDSTTSQQSGVA